MIFVTVGTHEQPFNRLLRIIDNMIERKEITEEVIVQKGYSDYELKNCKSYKIIGYDEMKKYIEDARIIVSHGGPASFIAPISIGKIPIVVPRQKKYNEHVNDHQLEFTRQVEQRMNNIIVAETEMEIIDAIINYDRIISKKSGTIRIHNSEFIKAFNEEIQKVL